MDQRVKIRKVGNSVAISLPKTILEKSKFKEGDDVILDAPSEGVLRIYRDKSESDLSRSIKKLRLKKDIVQRSKKVIEADQKLTITRWNEGYSEAGWDESLMNFAMADYEKRLLEKDLEEAEIDYEILELQEALKSIKETK